MCTAKTPCKKKKTRKERKEHTDGNVHVPVGLDPVGLSVRGEGAGRREIRGGPVSWRTHFDERSKMEQGSSQRGRPVK